MKRSFVVLCLLLVLGVDSQAQSDTAAYRALSREIQQKFAPDKRAIYVNLQIKGDSIRLESSSATVLQEYNLARPKNSTSIFSSVLLPAKSLSGLEYGVSNLSVSNNRANPQNSAELMTQMLLGTPVRILKKQGGYFLVKTPDGYLSWTDGAAVKAMDSVQFAGWRNTEKVVFIADYGHSFAKPTDNAARVSDLVSGNILQKLGEEKLYVKVGYPDGRVAYVPKNQLQSYSKWVSRANPNANIILKTAQTLIGVPYLWGGTSIKGVDCSGFTKTAYFLNGIIIPRDASQQALIGQEVDVLVNDSISVEKCLKNLNPGDLMFFSAAKRRGINGGRVSHTAIYMGNGEFIQSAGMVRINSIVPTAINYDGAQSGTLVGARRILTEIGKPEITRIENHSWYNKN